MQSYWGLCKSYQGPWLGVSVPPALLPVFLSPFFVAAAAAKSLQSYPTLCDPIDGSPPVSPVPGISKQEHWSGLPFPSPSLLLLIINLFSCSFIYFHNFELASPLYICVFINPPFSELRATYMFTCWFTKPLFPVRPCRKYKEMSVSWPPSFCCLKGKGGIRRDSEDEGQESTAKPLLGICPELRSLRSHGCLAHRRGSRNIWTVMSKQYPLRLRLQRQDDLSWKLLSNHFLGGQKCAEASFSVGQEIAF